MCTSKPRLSYVYNPTKPPFPKSVSTYRTAEKNFNGTRVRVIKAATCRLGTNTLRTHHTHRASRLLLSIPLAIFICVCGRIFSSRHVQLQFRKRASRALASTMHRIAISIDGAIDMYAVPIRLFDFPLFLRTRLLVLEGPLPRTGDLPTRRKPWLREPLLTG